MEDGRRFSEGWSVDRLKNILTGCATGGAWLFGHWGIAYEVPSELPLTVTAAKPLNAFVRAIKPWVSGAIVFTFKSSAKTNLSTILRFALLIT